VVARYNPGSPNRKHTEAADQKFESRNGAVILVADDSEADRFFLLRTFKTSGLNNPVHFVNAGAEVIQYLNGEGKYADRNLYPLPGAIFLDLHMPPPNGFEVLRWKEKEKRIGISSILWVAMSAFNSVRTINDAYTAGASTYLAKPLDAADIRNLIEAFEDYWRFTSPPYAQSSAPKA
jgi:CheY-like chemotaxis protein